MLVSRLRRAGPALAVLLLAPCFGECLSGASSPLQVLVPWRFPLLVALYGGGALVCREVARRRGLGWPGLLLLGAAYGVLEEGLVDRYWFDPRFWHEAGVGTYGVVGGASVLLAVHLTLFHAVVSVMATVVVVERVVPDRAEQPWVGPRVLVAVTAVLLLAVPPLYGALGRGPGAPALLVTAGIVVALVLAALGTGSGRPRRLGRSVPPARPRRGLAVTAFLAAALHFGLVYGVPATGLPWPLGLAVALAPVAAGVAVGRRLRSRDGGDALRVVLGVVTWFCLLDVVLGLGGRYDLSGFGLVVLVVLVRLRPRGVRPVRRAAPG